MTPIQIYKAGDNHFCVVQGEDVAHGLCFDEMLAIVIGRTFENQPPYMMTADSIVFRMAHRARRRRDKDQ
ncbi:MAG: hypothetical protein KDA32_10915 [Phycisphaerales bacterium]|nr:hypothetical protein [Phycisphaerales bacterium]